jgi:VCBS repeat-containing protein
MTCHHLYITTPDNIDKDKVFENWRNFDGGDFSLDQDGDWEFSDLYEVDKEDMDIFHVDWEEEIK